MAGYERSPMLPKPHEPRYLKTLKAAVLVAATVSLLALLGVSSFSSRHQQLRQPDTLSAAAVDYPANAADGSRNLLQFCDERFITQQLNHFDPAEAASGSYQQRYFVCASEHFNAQNGSIFFYAGNEADVELYLNHTGLMWENARAFQALVVFAEHRYFGKSIPFPPETLLDNMQFLSSTQALADFAVLIDALKVELKADVPVIGFGGSYGGMLAAWLRMKYPNVVDGVIAASAPVLAFGGDIEHPVDSEGFQRVSAFDMSPAAGASTNCIPNVRRAIASFTEIGQTPAGRRHLATLFRLCDVDSLQTQDDVTGLVYSAIGAFGNMAMGNYPYPSAYITEGQGELPTYPVRAACQHLEAELEDTDALLEAFRDSVGVFYNVSQGEKCYFPAAPPSASNQSAIDIKGNFWGYLECSELYMPFSSDGVHDVFPAAPADEALDDANCMATWGVHLRPRWATIEYGGVKALRSASNIVFSNGDYDPWSATGVLFNVSDSVVAVPVAGGAHHVDLFFTHALDPPSLTQARATELQHMRKWVQQFYVAKNKRDA